MNNKTKEKFTDGACKGQINNKLLVWFVCFCIFRELIYDLVVLFVWLLLVTELSALPRPTAGTFIGLWVLGSKIGVKICTLIHPVNIVPCFLFAVFASVLSPRRVLFCLPTVWLCEPLLCHHTMLHWFVCDDIRVEVFFGCVDGRMLWKMSHWVAHFSATPQRKSRLIIGKSCRNICALGLSWKMPVGHTNLSAGELFAFGSEQSDKLPLEKHANMWVP